MCVRALSLGQIKMYAGQRDRRSKWEENRKQTLETQRFITDHGQPRGVKRCVDTC